MIKRNTCSACTENMVSFFSLHSSSRGFGCMEMNFKVSASGLTDIGLHRSCNEDSFFIDRDAGCFLVADGMGGAAAGEIASRIFADKAAGLILQSENQSENNAVALIKKIFLSANAKIRNHILHNPDHRGMGCTADLLLFHNNGFALGHVGDSRSYRLRQGQLTRLTKDHSLVQDQLDQGLISIDEARTHRLRNVISRAVGIEDQLKVDIIRGQCLAEDLFLLCSDGLTDMVPEELISKILLSKESLPQRSALLIERAKANGGRDNITVVLVEISI